MQDNSDAILETVQHYRLADEAEAKAKAIFDNPIAKKSYEATAANWRRLAKHLDPSWQRA
jgi:plasmid stabilization system protein ParE